MAKWKSVLHDSHENTVAVPHQVAKNLNNKNNIHSIQKLLFSLSLKDESQ